MLIFALTHAKVLPLYANNSLDNKGKTNCPDLRDSTPMIVSAYLSWTLFLYSSALKKVPSLDAYEQSPQKRARQGVFTGCLMEKSFLESITCDPDAK